MHTLRPRLLLFLALLLSPLLGACAGTDGGEGGWSLTTDTLDNGALLIVNTPPSSGGQSTWILEEELRIGTRDAGGPAQFGQLKGLAVTEDGSVAVLDAQAREVRIFASDGSHRATWGGPGEGPGEFGEPWGLMRSADDRIWVPDHGNDRMTILHPASGLETSYPMPVLRFGFIWEGVMLDDGRILKPSITLGPPRRELFRIYDREMTLVDSILVPEPEGPPTDPTDPPGSFYFEGSGGVRGYMGVPFYPRGHRVFDPSGHIWSSTPGDPAYRITRTTLEGDTTLVIETRRAEVPIPDAVRDSAIEQVQERLRERGSATNQDYSKVPRVKPAVEGLFLGEDGRLWVRSASAGPGVTYDVYEATGEYAGTAVSDLNLSPWLAPVVRGDRLWGVVTDALDVPYVVQARLREDTTGGA